MTMKQRVTARRSCVLILASLTYMMSAQAQSSLALYGIVDGSVMYTSRTLNLSTKRNDGHQVSFIDSGFSSSRFGLTGKEDLGNGFQTSFKLESGFSIANGAFAHSNGNLFGRHAWIALSSPYGTVTTGLQHSPFFLASDRLDPRHSSNFGSGIVTYVDNVIASGIFSANAIGYASPQIGGVGARVMLGLGNAANGFASGRTWSASVDYGYDGLFVGAAFYDSNAGAAPTPTLTTRQFEGRLIGASYQFGSVTAAASFTNYKVAGIANNDVCAGGFEIHVTPAFSMNTGVYFTSDRNHTGDHSILAAVGAGYALSKRTWIYAQGGLVDNHGGMNTGLALTNALYASSGRTTGADIGFRHSF
ncbi:porin [Burkholderia contaminans]|uniref:porin n=1 Tax=Burkholderia contaminans TaxID=488447 RepID=UPI0035D58ADC